VAKLSPAGDSLVYSTYLGGSGDDRAFGIAVDASGAAIVTGWTYSADFPTVAAAQSVPGGWRDAFVAKLESLGGRAGVQHVSGGQRFGFGQWRGGGCTGRHLRGRRDRFDRLPGAERFRVSQSRFERRFCG